MYQIIAFNFKSAYDFYVRFLFFGSRLVLKHLCHSKQTNQKFIIRLLTQII